MKKYEMPEFEIHKFSETDVLIESNDNDNDGKDRLWLTAIWN